MMANAWAVAALLAAIAFSVALIAFPPLLHVLAVIYGAGVYTALFLAFVVAPIARRS